MVLAPEGITIVDLAWLSPGNLCSLPYSGLSADAVDAYKPLRELRSWGTRYDQHTDETLREVDYDDFRIRELCETDAVS